MSHAHRFRFGVQCLRLGSGREWREQARKIEALGYATLLVPDHLTSKPMAQMVAMAFAAEATTTLRVGMLVAANDFKHPAVLAKEAATLDVLSGGRLEFGIGAGWERADYDAIGLRFDSPGVRIDRLAESLHIVRQAWGDGPFSFASEHYTVTEYDGEPKPLQRPRPPVMVGGSGPRILRLAGREADIVGVFQHRAADHQRIATGSVGTDVPPPPTADTSSDLTTRQIGWVREGAGDRFDNIELQARCTIGATITDDPQAFAEERGPIYGLTPDQVLRSATALVGTVEECCDVLVQRRETWGFSYIVLQEDSFEEFAPVVATLAGS